MFLNQNGEDDILKAHIKKKIKVCVVHVGPGGHVRVYDLCCHPRPCWSFLPAEATMRFTVCTSPEDCVTIQMGTVCAPSRGHVVVHGLCYHRRVCWCLWSVLLPEAMLISMVLAEGCVDVRGPCCQQKLCGSPWSMLPLTLKGKQASFVVVSMTADSQLRMLKKKKLKESIYSSSRLRFWPNLVSLGLAQYWPLFPCLFSFLMKLPSWLTELLPSSLCSCHY